MNLLKSTLIILFCLASTQGFCQYTEVINSNRPGVSRSAFSVGTNVVQFEVGPYFNKEERTPAAAYEATGFGVDFAARYGLLWEPLEISLEGTYQNDTQKFVSDYDSDYKRSNFKYFTIGAKYLVFDPLKNKPEEKPNLYSWKANRAFKWKSLIPAVSVYVGGNIDSADNPFTATGIEGFSPKVMIATQNNFASGWVFVMNFIKDRIGTDQSDFQYILTLTHAVTTKWVIFGETQGIKSDFYADNLFRLGAAYLWNKNLQLDSAITFNTKDTPAVFSVNFGASYRLDFHKDKRPNVSNDVEDLENGTPNNLGNTGKKKKDTEPEPIEKRKKEDIDFD
ncbi:transporter [Tamlana sp. 2_MG-2023]|uniref:transporter n=1 Tax=unclassified Tamlana TaxID=2614803 RepID=UPI0026E1C3A5|nr:MULTISPECIES: transporter [unclassified Tamlana]MDO6759389.1 transporter [Tamlana sp. 2_MG-2023]MDO6790472.1 transporter [Tamlana sp. 1_MG-2023]